MSGLDMRAEAERPLQSRLLVWLMAIMVVMALAGAFRVGLDRGFDHTIGTEAWGRMLFGIGGAISHKSPGGKGYVIYGVVETVLQYGGLTGKPEILTSLGLTFPANLQNPVLIDAAIRKAAEFPNVASPVRGSGGDDLGFVDFVRLAFWLFGYNLLSLYLNYYMLFSISVWAFFLAFRDRPACLAILALAVLAHLGLFVSALFDLTNDTPGSPTNPRFLSVLAVVPGLHLGLAMRLGLSPSWRNVGLTALQAGMVVLACWIRASAVWVPVALALLAMGIGVRTRSVRPLWSLGVLAGLWLLHGIYISQTLNPVYKESGDTPHHVVWHSIFYSLQFNPEWQTKYAAIYDKADSDDLTTIVAKKYLERHPVANRDALYNPATGTLKWTVIESTVRNAFFEFFVRDPQFVLSTFFVHKPRYLATQLGAYTVSIGRLSRNWGGVMIGAGLVMIVFLALTVVERRAFTQCAALLTGAFSVSLIPILLTVPFRAVIADQFFMLLYAGAAWSVALPALAIGAGVSLARSRRWLPGTGPGVDEDDEVQGERSASEANLSDRAR